MLYIIYKITNILDGKIYIGKHQTSDLNDGYMGSGKYLKRAQVKYGIENFKKEVIFIFECENEMNEKESELVTEQFCLDENTYNLCVGGKGGFSYINRMGLSGKYPNKKDMNIQKLKHASLVKAECEKDPVWKQRSRENVSKGLKLYFNNTDGHFKGKLHTTETKRKIGEANSKMTGSSNSQYGSIWITNGHLNKKIHKSEDIPEGWYKGRKIQTTPVAIKEPVLL